MLSSARTSSLWWISLVMLARESHQESEEPFKVYLSITSIKIPLRSSKMLFTRRMNTVTFYLSTSRPTISTSPKLISNQSIQLKRRPVNPSKSQSTWPSRSKLSQSRLRLNTRQRSTSKRLQLYFSDRVFSLRFQTRDLWSFNGRKEPRTTPLDQLV